MQSIEEQALSTGKSSSPLDRYFHPILDLSKVGKSPVPIQFEGEPYVLFRNPSGQLGVLHDRCPHRFAPLSKGRIQADGRLQCPYHGWRFDCAGKGESPSQPSLKKCDVSALQVFEKYGFAWIATQEVPPERMPNYEWDDYWFAGQSSTLFEAPLHVVLDNFSEDEHTPFVHHALGWDEADCDSIVFSAENFDDRSEVQYQAKQRRFPLMKALLIQPGDLFNNHWTTFYDPVRLMYRIFWTNPQNGEERGFQIRVVLHMVPITPHRTALQAFLWTRYRDLKSEKHWVVKVTQPFVRRFIRREIEDDAKFIPTVADTPPSMSGMRLGKYDKPLVNNQKLLNSLYWQRTDSTINGSGEYVSD